ncbi:uncharacterized protein LOC134260103 [Saccostrea cucullata]|uniref:uncharacterized protein LOC134260103 n=1 Tax=Saccostrea cuccullata TaxID=36930 RepID=UPI002ED534DA
MEGVPLDSVIYDIILPQSSLIEETPLSLDVNKIQFEDCELTPLASSTPNPKRKPTWSELEQNILLEEVTKNEKTLFGKFKGPGRGKREREEAWENVARAVNEVGICLRTGKEASKQYANLKTRAKDKLSQMKRPKTGGGPKPPSPTPVEQAMLNTLEGRPSMQGLDSGFDSGDMEVDCSSGESASNSTTSATCISSTQNSCAAKSQKGPEKKTKSLIELQKDLLMTEKKKMEMEMEVLKLKKEKLVEEMELLRIQKERLLN